MLSDITLVSERIREVAAQKKISLRQIAKDIRMTPSGFHRSLESGTLKVSTVCRISDVLDVEPYVFFVDFDVFFRKNKLAKRDHLMEHMQDHINSLHKEIDELKEQIKILSIKN